ncbi:MAG: acetoin utilization protein acuB [Bacteroidia bacterium]|nr:acetoin utilization protein acuB [Bacteroidia bacterium]NND24395.1 acetoin utilization protein acuB [Flavobacteriaceae bacterium]MBT8279781.1 acetoin utilization protein acuB [Bacteroidia bacterium]NNK59876.1 acetoin utilization protein acuB [Flavobacteriaceae bacterium]NNL31749.1 acetoin utilization protein acuB [Flavobacteriaceae bacterium]
MPLSEYIINDIRPIAIKSKVKQAQELFSQLTYSHIPIEKDGVYIGCLSETDVHCFDSDKTLDQYVYAAEGFHVWRHNIWLDVLEAFAQNDSNIMPVLDDKNNYLGYYELNDIISLFNDTPFFSEPGGILIVEKGYNDYSFSEASQIVETNNAKMLGAFVSKIENDVVQLTIKINNTGMNEIIQAFRRYGYNIISGHQEDVFLKNLKDRSDYLNKYLNL